MLAVADRSAISCSFHNLSASSLLFFVVDDCKNNQNFAVPTKTLPRLTLLK
jgi:hypothetical protein